MMILRFATPLLLCCFLPVAAPCQTLLQHRVSLDHVNIAVANPDSALVLFRDSLGFTIKPGRPHRNGIRNGFAKFSDGSLLEIITAGPSAYPDNLSRWYQERVAQHPAGSPAFLALRIEDPAGMPRRLPVLALEHTGAGYADILSFSPADSLFPLFFIGYNYPVDERPEYLQHDNTAQRLLAVWIGRDWWRQLAARLNWHLSGTTRLPGIAEPVEVVELKRGALYLVAGDRALYGVTVEVASFSGNLRKARPVQTPRGRSLLIPAEKACGLTVEFLIRDGTPGN